MEKSAKLEQFEAGIDKYCEDEELDSETAEQLKSAILDDIETLEKAAANGDTGNGDSSGDDPGIIDILRDRLSGAANWAKENKDITVPATAGLSTAGAEALFGDGPDLGSLAAGAGAAGLASGYQNRARIQQELQPVIQALLTEETLQKIRNPQENK